MLASASAPTAARAAARLPIRCMMSIRMRHTPSVNSMTNGKQAGRKYLGSIAFPLKNSCPKKATASQTAATFVRVRRSEEMRFVLTVRFLKTPYAATNNTAAGAAPKNCPRASRYRTNSAEPRGSAMPRKCNTPVTASSSSTKAAERQQPRTKRLAFFHTSNVFPRVTMMTSRRYDDQCGGTLLGQHSGDRPQAKGHQQAAPAGH